MFKFSLIFLLLWRLLGNPIVAILVLLLILYLLDRRFIGMLPSLTKPLKRLSRIRKLRLHIRSSPNDVSAKLELARLLMSRKRYQEARSWLEPLQRVLDDSAEYWDDLGSCLLYTGEMERGVEAMTKALSLNPRVKYGTPYLRLASHYAQTDSEKALAYLEAFQDIHSSSCEAFLQLTAIYKGMGQPELAKQAANEGLQVYRSLPSYKRKSERRYAVRLQLSKFI